MTVFPTDPAGLPEATGPALVELADGDTFDLRIGPVAKRLGDTTVRMLGYSGSIPGPTLKVPQGAEIRVEVTNHGDLDTTVHWHGLRLENRYDGVPHETQAPIPVGGGFTYRIQFPDPGLYWYHPHIREDYTQELGLYGNILVVPAEPDYWPPADREFVLTLDDVLVEDGAIAPFSTTEISHVAMGRYGTVLLTAGDTDLQLTAEAGDVVRLWLTNTANTRVFNVRLPGARMKLVGGDSGRVEREELVEEVLLAPSERAVVDVLVDRVGALALEHHTPTRAYRLATLTAGERRPAPPISKPAAASDSGPAAASATGLAAASAAGPTVGGLAAASDAGPAAASDAELAVASAAGSTVGGRAAAAAERFAVLRDAPDLRAERQQLARWIAAPPDKTLALVAEMDDVAAAGDGPVVYTCPMHPEVTSAEPGRCPQCGMKLLAAGADTAHTHHEDHDHMAGHASHGDAGGHDDMAGHAGHSHGGGHDDMAGHAGGHGGGIEWEDEMVDVNRLTTTANMRWRIVDRGTGAANAGIDWRFTVGERVKIRLVNEMDSDHPMHHPFHIHGAGRFLVLARDGRVEPNLVWKDTVLIRTGQVVDILLDVTNPGLWMAHCHIAEHMQGGMMFSFTVTREQVGR